MYTECLISYEMDTHKIYTDVPGSIKNFFTTYISYYTPKLTSRVINTYRYLFEIPLFNRL